MRKFQNQYQNSKSFHFRVERSVFVFILYMQKIFYILMS